MGNCFQGKDDSHTSTTVIHERKELLDDRKLDLSQHDIKILPPTVISLEDDGEEAEETAFHELLHGELSITMKIASDEFDLTQHGPLLNEM